MKNINTQLKKNSFSTFNFNFVETPTLNKFKKLSRLS